MPVATSVDPPKRADARGWAVVGLCAVFAVLFGLYGLGLFGGPFNPILVFLAVAVYMMGRQEVEAVRQEEAYKRRQAMSDDEGEWYDDRRDRGREWDRGGQSELNGWVFHTDTGEWVEYRDGWPVRRFRDR